MSADLVNQIKTVAHAMISRMAQGRWGLICSTRTTKDGYEVRAMLQPENVMTGWLPVLSPMVGPNWGIVCPPALNSEAFIVPHEGAADHGVVVGMTFNVQDMPPQPGGVPITEGQFALMHKNGSYLVFNDDDVILVTNRDLLATVGRDAKVLAKNSLTVSSPTITIDADGNGGNATVQITGNLNVSGDVAWGDPATHASTHRHGEGTPVPAGTVPPTPGS